jgi:hypothetical protein
VSEIFADFKSAFRLTIRSRINLLRYSFTVDAGANSIQWMVYFSRSWRLAFSEDHPAFADNKRVVVDSIIRHENSVSSVVRPDFHQSGTRVAISRVSEFLCRQTQTVFRHLASQCCLEAPKMLRQS